MGILHIINVENLFIYLSEAPQSVYIYLADTFLFQTESTFIVEMRIVTITTTTMTKKSAYLKRGKFI